MHEVAGNHSGAVAGLHDVTTNPIADADRDYQDDLNDAAAGADIQVTNEGRGAAGVAAKSAAAAAAAAVTVAAPVGTAVGFGKVGSSAVGSGEAGSSRVGGRWTDCYCQECNDAYERQALHVSVVGGSAVGGGVLEESVIGVNARGKDKPTLPTNSSGNPLTQVNAGCTEKPTVLNSSSSGNSSSSSPYMQVNAECREKPTVQVSAMHKEKPTVLLLHGFGAASSFWTDTVVPFLPRSFLDGRRVVAVDLLGWGKSPKPRDCDYSVEEHVRVPCTCTLMFLQPSLSMLPLSSLLVPTSSWIEHTFDRAHMLAPLNICTFHIVGHSMGCLIPAACTLLPPTLPLTLHPKQLDRAHVLETHTHSMGCLMAAVLAARNRDRVVSVCLYSPASHQQRSSTASSPRAASPPYSSWASASCHGSSTWAESSAPFESTQMSSPPHCSSASASCRGSSTWEGGEGGLTCKPLPTAASSENLFASISLSPFPFAFSSFPLCPCPQPFIPPRPGLTPAEEFYRLVTPRCLSSALLLGISVMSWFEHVGRVICAFLVQFHWLSDPLAALLLPRIGAK
ncbi:unnamed protein product [Closterium sp. Naga37s-1]|nr:unnamed protein product [Closterium sp. Naga37s-1]